MELNFDAFYLQLKDVFKNPRPWAHIRFGDGEGIVMGYPEYTSKQRCAKRWAKWIGHSDIDMEAFAIEIRNAVEMADIAGLPCKRHQKVNQNWRNVKKYIKKYKLLNHESLTCCMDWTVELQRRDLYKELLFDKEDVVYISCRNVAEQLKNKFNIKKVHAFHLPPQHRPFVGEVLTGKKHYPNIYYEIMSYLSDDLTGKIFLVGAGGLGKIYCSWIKRGGGVALDIGSIFDGWAGLRTRSYLNEINRYRI